MDLEVSKAMLKKLDEFLSVKTCTDIDRTKFIPCELKDNVNKLNTCLVFNCNCHSYEDPTIIPCEYSGAVIHIPAFWLEVPKELAFNYIINLLNDLYSQTYKQWQIDYIIGNNTGSSGYNNCGCDCNGWREV